MYNMVLTLRRLVHNMPVCAIDVFLLMLNQAAAIFQLPTLNLLNPMETNLSKFQNKNPIKIES